MTQDLFARAAAAGIVPGGLEYDPPDTVPVGCVSSDWWYRFADSALRYPVAAEMVALLLEGAALRWLSEQRPVPDEIAVCPVGDPLGSKWWVYVNDEIKGKASTRLEALIAAVEAVRGSNG